MITLYICCCRIIASLQRIYSDFTKPILDTLMRELYGQLRNNKLSQQIDCRVRNIRFLAELTKFKVAPPVAAFRMCSAFLDDFTRIMWRC